MRFAHRRHRTPAWCMRLLAGTLVLLVPLASCSGRRPSETPWSPVESGAGRRTVDRPAPTTRGTDDAGHVGITVGSLPVRARLARTAEEHHRGLSGVARLDEDEGMLFIYGKALVRNFWMQGCLIALDIAYVGEDGRVFQLATLDPPDPDRPTRRIPAVLSERPVALVLEMPGGWFARHGLGVGTRLELPAGLRKPDRR